MLFRSDGGAGLLLRKFCRFFSGSPRQSLVSMPTSQSPSQDSFPSQSEPMGQLAILAGSGNPLFAGRIAECLGVSLTPGQAQVFSEGNVFVRVLENVRGRDCFVVQGVHRPVNDNFVELLFWIDALKRASASQVTAVIPYFSYEIGRAHV